LGAVLVIFVFCQRLSADVIYNILAVNSTDTIKEEEVKLFLPKEIRMEDVVDAAGLKVDYDVQENLYFVTGKVSLEPKESRTLKVKLKDVWKIHEQDIQEIKEQVDLSIERLKDTEYYDLAKVKKESLMQRLDFIVDQQKKVSGDVEKRIDQYRTYLTEVEDIRSNSMSVKYWRAQPPTKDTTKTVEYFVRMENEGPKPVNTAEQKYYLPSEIKPENIVDLQGFDIRYDEQKGASYLTRSEDLAPGEVKTFQITLADVWNIDPSNIENLRERTRKAFKLLEKTEYSESAKYLVDNVKEKLEVIELAQAQQKDMKGHISDYRYNTKAYQEALKDVESMESLLEAVRENLERSKLKNVLEKIRSLRSIVDLAKSVFKKPHVNTAWKIILGIIIFVGILTTIHFAIWGKRSREAKLKRLDEAANAQANEQNKQT
jgi:hypothetical protein